MDSAVEEKLPKAVPRMVPSLAPSAKRPLMPVMVEELDIAGKGVCKARDIAGTCAYITIDLSLTCKSKKTPTSAQFDVGNTISIKNSSS